MAEEDNRVVTIYGNEARSRRLNGEPSDWIDACGPTCHHKTLYEALACREKQQAAIPVHADEEPTSLGHMLSMAMALDLRERGVTIEMRTVKFTITREPIDQDDVAKVNP